ncbi:M28 family peptidase [bacterium]|nr:M28 family peptidase [bacterium]
MAAGLVVLGILGAALGRYQCRCPGAAKTAESIGMEVSADNLQRHVEKLAGQIGERNVWRPDRLEQAAAYIEAVWREQGWTVARQVYEVNKAECANLEVTLPGADRAAEIVVVGAHYDSLPFSPGANDNGSGVAALLEITRAIGRGSVPARTLKFVAFVNEEPPFFWTAQMGSRVYARRAREQGDDIRAMLSLETIGYYTDAPRSQRYPPLFRWFYPSRGNFLAFVSNLRSRPLLHEVMTRFRARSRFPAECCATWGAIRGVSWSDHSSFWHEGYPAVMVTDTAPFRYPHYHTEDDTPDKIDYDKLAEVTAGVAAVVTDLAALPAGVAANERQSAGIDHHPVARKSPTAGQ